MAAALAYCLQSLDPRSDWPQRFAHLLEAFPHLAVELDLRESMGMLPEWNAESLWSPGSLERSIRPARVRELVDAACGPERALE